MGKHLEICPACGSAINVHVLAHEGGSVDEVLALSVASKSSEVGNVLATARAAVEKAQADAVKAAQAVLAEAKEAKVSA